MNTLRAHATGNKLRLSSLIAILLIFLLATACGQANGLIPMVSSPTPTPLPSLAMRAIWVQDDADSTPAELDATLDQIAQAGFDTVLYLVGSGVVRYESDLLPRASSVANGFDSLAYVVQAAHARGLKVQAWWCPGIAVQGTEFRHQHPSWDIATVRGIPDNFHWLNFSKPEVRQFVGDVVLEIAQKYEVDGIHLDYIRYPPPPPYSPIDPRKFFGANDVPQTVKDAYSRLKAVKPNVELTAAVLDGQAASANHLQNWAEWLAGGYIDAVMPMAYYGPSEEAELSRRIAEWKALPHAERVVPGLSVAYSLKLGKTNPKSWEQSDAQIGLLRANGFNGYAIFDSQTLTGEILNGLSASR